MNTKLKRAIITWVLDNLDEFQIHNAAVRQFTPYIFDSHGRYLIGGEDVLEFITRSIDLIQS